MDALHQLEFRLAYSECDPAGIVYYGAYHPWMERTYTDWTALVDARTDQLTATTGVATVSRHSSVSYERPARVFDLLRCEMRLGAIGRSSYTLRYDFVDQVDGGRYAMGTMTLVASTDGRAVPVPDELRAKLESAGPPVGLT